MIEIYVVEYPGKHDRMFTNVGDAKNCLANIWEIHLGRISVYKWEKTWEIVWTKWKNKNIYVYSEI